MPNWQPITQERHGGKHWRRFGSYRFAADRVLLPLAAAELSRAVMHLPIAFAHTEQGPMLCALLGVQPDRNLFVGANGRWQGGYVPAALRGHPFALARTGEDQLTLCIDEDSGLLTSPPDGEPFFGAEGKPTQAIQDVLKFLEQTERSRASAAALCKQLQEAGLIAEWPVKLKTSAGEQPLGGLQRVDESALGACPADTLKALQQSGALTLAYCQLLSMQHLQRLGELAQGQAQSAQQRRDDLGFLSSDGSLDFSSQH